MEEGPGVVMAGALGGTGVVGAVVVEAEVGAGGVRAAGGVAANRACASRTWRGVVLAACVLYIIAC